MVYQFEKNNSTVKRQSTQLPWTHCLFWASQFFKINYLHTSKNTFYQDSRSNMNSYVRYYKYCDEHWQEKKLFFLFKIYKNSISWRILGLAFGLKPINLNA